MKKITLMMTLVLSGLLSGCFFSGDGSETGSNIWNNEVENTDLAYVSTVSLSSDMEIEENDEPDFEEIIASSEVLMYDSSGEAKAVSAGSYRPANMYTEGNMTFITYLDEKSPIFDDFKETASIENFDGTAIFKWSDDERTILIDSFNNKVYSLESLFEVIGEKNSLVLDASDVKSINTHIFGSTIYFYTTSKIFSIDVTPQGIEVVELLDIQKDLNADVISILELVSNENKDILFKVDTGVQEQIIFFNKGKQTGHIVEENARNSFLLQGEKESMYLMSDSGYLELYSVNSGNENDEVKKVWSTLDRENIFNDNLDSMNLKTFGDKSVLSSVRDSGSSFITIMHNDVSVHGEAVVIVDKNIILERETTSFTMSKYDINEDGKLFVLYKTGDIMNSTQIYMYDIYELEKEHKVVVSGVKTFAIEVNGQSELGVLSETVFKTLRIDVYDRNGNAISDSKFENINNRLNVFINHIRGE